VRVGAKDEDCDEKRSATRSCNGQPFRFIHGHSRPAAKGPNRFKLRRRTAVIFLERRNGTVLEWLVSRQDFHRVRRHHWYAVSHTVCGESVFDDAERNGRIEVLSAQFVPSFKSKPGSSRVFCFLHHRSQIFGRGGNYAVPLSLRLLASTSSQGLNAALSLWIDQLHSNIADQRC
jgi:hypothetical protein